MNLRLVLEQARPELLLELLLAQDKCDIAAAVLDLRLLRVDLGEELEVDSVGDLFRCRSSLEAKLCGLQVELQVGLGDIGGNDGEEDVVPLGVAVGRALRPSDCAESVYIAGTSSCNSMCMQLSSCDSTTSLCGMLRGELLSTRLQRTFRCDGRCRHNCGCVYVGVRWMSGLGEAGCFMDCMTK